MRPDWQYEQVNIGYSVSLTLEELFEDADVFVVDCFGHLVLVEEQSVGFVFFGLPLERRILLQFTLLLQSATANHKFIWILLSTRVLCYDVDVFFNLCVCSYRKSERILLKCAFDNHPSNGLLLCQLYHALIYWCLELKWKSMKAGISVHFKVGF